MSSLLCLCPQEQVRLDTHRLGAIYRDLGPVRADSYLARTLEECAERLERLDGLRDAPDPGEIAAQARSLRYVAMRLGMVTLARVAGDVERCARRADPHARAATLARLVRLGGHSLAALWEIDEIEV